MRIEGLSNNLNELSKTATNVCRKLAEQQLELLSNNISLLSNHAKRLSSAKNPTDFLSIQKECLAENLETTVKNFQKVLNTSVESLEEITKACSSKQQTTIKTKTKKSKKRAK